MTHKLMDLPTQDWIPGMSSVVRLSVHRSRWAEVTFPALRCHPSGEEHLNATHLHAAHLRATAFTSSSAALWFMIAPANELKLW